MASESTANLTERMENTNQDDSSKDDKGTEQVDLSLGDLVSRINVLPELM